MRVLLARPAPLDVSDEALERWFKELPDLPLPPGGDGAAVCFDNYAVVTTGAAGRVRARGVRRPVRALAGAVAEVDR